MTQKEMLQQLLNATTDIRKDIANLTSRVETLEKGKAPKTAKGKGNNKVVEAPKTRKEAIAEWASKKYSEAERQAYGEQKRAEREAQKKAYEATNKKFKERVDRSIWKAEYDKQLKKFSK